MCRRVILMFLTAAVLANAQWQLNRADSEKVERALNKGITGEPLKCSIRPIDPFLDFAFRFDAGYVVTCPVKEFGGAKDNLVAYMRITPDNGLPIVLARGYQLPAIPRALSGKINIRKVNTSFEMSGGFILGQGRYAVDVVLVDSQNRIRRARWSMNAALSGHEKDVPVTTAPHTAAQFPVKWWDGKSCTNRRPGSRLTILLNAAPMNPYANKLRAWDRAFLLGALSSLLRQTPAESVRLIAFNLDQQREIFRDDHFDQAGFPRLSEALERLELGAVSYKTLQRRNGWADTLARLINEQLTAQPPSDSVVFLGPTIRITQKFPESMLNPLGPRSPQFFYFEYYPVWLSGREFPDAIHSATRACQGTTLKIHSPGEFAEAMQKVNERLVLRRSDSEPQNAPTMKPSAKD